MKKTLLSAIAAVLLAGCSTVSAPIAYRPANHSGPPWSIGGQLDAYDLTITVNGEKAVTGRLSLWDGSGEFSGAYSGARLEASCASKNATVRCMVFVNGERAATLIFD